jgi:hypothetical protein
MFATRYFPDRYFAPRYFPKDGATPITFVSLATVVSLSYSVTIVDSLAYSVATVESLAYSLTSVIYWGPDMVDLQTGDTVDVTGTFKDRDEALFDPTGDVFCIVTDPSGTAVTYEAGVDAELVAVSTGVYRMTFPVSAKGRWRWRMYSTGQLAADTGSLLVEQPSW